ncbi:MAG TPA: PEP-CTERM sorting domain-containing protein [Vicinamibacterales bacterium]|nr:PEP-CTERM sorting domain-containing protein [Vicinamibacterales bacterium]
MRNRLWARLLVTSTALGVFACPANADLITFSSRTTFNAAAPGLPVETFESRDAEGVLICPGPLMRGQECPLTPGTVLPLPPFDGLLPGVTYSSTSGLLVLVGRDSFTGFDNTSNVLGPFANGDTLDLTFAYASAIGFDVFPGFVAPGQIVISVFDPVNAPMGSFPILASPTGTFFGVLSGSGRIGRINVDTVAELPGGLVDDVAFGAAIPEPATILLLGSGLAGLGALARRRRRQRPPQQPN